MDCQAETNSFQKLIQYCWADNYNAVYDLIVNQNVDMERPVTANDVEVKEFLMFHCLWVHSRPTD